MCYAQDSFAIVGPKLGYREKIIALTDQPIDTLLMSSGQASSLRGSLGPLDVGLFGRVCRGASSALIARQYYELTLAVHTSLLYCLHYVRTIVQMVQDRMIPIGPSVEPPVIIYSDASLEQGILTIGAVCLPPHGKPQAFQWIVPADVIQEVMDNDHNINKGELLAAPVSIWTFYELIRNRDVT